MKEHNKDTDQVAGDTQQSASVSEQRYRMLFDSIGQGFCVVELIWDSNGNAVDYRFLEVNAAFKKQTGFIDGVGKTALEIAPELEKHWFKIFGEVVKTGKAVHFEHEAVTLVGNWYEVNAFAVGESQVGVLVNDITRRRKNEIALRESEERLKRAVNTARTVVWEWDIINNKIQTTDNFADVYGLSVIEFAEQGWSMLHPDDREAHLSKVQKSVKTGVGYHSRFRIIRPDTKRVIWLEERADALSDKDGKITKLAGASIEVTELKKSEAELRKSDEKYRNLFESMDEGYCIIQMLYKDKAQAYDWRFLEVNPAFERHNGLFNATGKTIREMAPEIEDKWIKIYGAVAETGRSIRFEEDSIALNRTFDLYAFRIGKPKERKVAVLFTNITERKHAQDVLREAEIQKKLHELEETQQREIFRITLQTIEEERQRMAENLHNGLGQVLYGVKISLAALSQQQAENEFARTKNYTSLLLTQAINESRRISHDLMPATLEEFGLGSAIHDICEQFKKQVHFTCSIKSNGKRLEKYLELAIYRTVQELMINVVKHAKAKRGGVTVVIDNEKITVKVADDGIGIDALKDDKPGIGLASIRSKIRLLNGDVKITSQPKKGTSVEIIIPMP